MIVGARALMAEGLFRGLLEETSAPGGDLLVEYVLANCERYSLRAL